MLTQKTDHINDYRYKMLIKDLIQKPFKVTENFFNRMSFSSKSVVSKKRQKFFILCATFMRTKTNLDVHEHSIVQSQVKEDRHFSGVPKGMQYLNQHRPFSSQELLLSKVLLFTFSSVKMREIRYHCSFSCLYFFFSL